MLRNDYPDLIETVFVKTRNDGRHYWFKLPEGMNFKSRQALMGPGLDFKADGGYVLLTPFFRIRIPFRILNTELQDLPTWVIERLSQLNLEKKGPKVVTVGAIPDGSRHLLPWLKRRQTQECRV